MLQETAAQAKRRLAAKKRAKAGGTKVVTGAKKPAPKPTFDQSKARPKGGLGALAKRTKAAKKAKKKIEY